VSTESRIETRREDWKAVISVVGPIDGKALRAEIDKVVKSGLVRIDLDLSRVKAMDPWDSTSLGRFVALMSWLESCGAKVTLVNLPPKLRDILNIANLSDGFE
jgi:anti-anti-sigma factor